jgi:pyrroline-5-carboxylate reductase
VHELYTLATSDLPTVGFIGVGAIAEALITGMCAEGEQRAHFLLSPRNAEIANGLAARYTFVTIAPDNQAVIDGSDIVFLAVRPQVAEGVLSQLKFRPEQRIVSLIATFNVERLRPLVAPATIIVRATPLPPVAQRRGALTMYPAVPEITLLLSGLGQLIPLESEADMDAFAVVTALLGTYFGLLDEVSNWLSNKT